MNRTATLTAAAALALALGTAFWVYSDDKPAEQPPAPAASAAEPAPTPIPTEASASLDPPASSRPPPSSSRFELEEDGSPVPPLPDGAPTRIKMGVALFAYEGAQGVPGQLRSREAALQLARSAISASQGQFAQILAKADPGSREDVGWIRRGVLERRVEHAVFQLDKGATSKEPIDTPRGYWVVLRTQ